MQKIIEKITSYLFKEEYLKDFVDQGYIKYISDKYLKSFIKILIKFHNNYNKVPNIDEYEKFVKEYENYHDYVILFQKLSKKNSPENYKFLIDHIKNEYIKNNFSKIIENVDYNNLNLQELNAELMNLIDTTEVDSDIKRGFIYENVKERYQMVKKGGVKAGIPSGFNVFDRHTGGLNKKELYLFFGRAGIGKTRWLFNMAYNLSIQYLWGMFFSLEMYREQMVRIFDSRHGKIKSEEIKYGKVDKKLYKSVLLDIKENQYPLEIIEHAKMTNIEFIVNEIKKFKKMYSLDFVVIDYLGLMSTGLKVSREEDLGIISRELKNIAKREDVIMITAAQANRKTMEQANVGLENIGYSDQIAHNADFVGYIKRGKIIDKILDVKILKNREGPSNVDMKFFVDFATNLIKDTIESKLGGR